MRKRKRPDYTVRVLQYRAYPREIPQKLWDIATTQRQLWNELVVLANRHAEWARLLGDKKTGWKDFDETARALVKQSGLDWVNGPAVLDRFRTAVSKNTRGWPRQHLGLDRIALMHRFTNGGIELGRLIDNARAKRFALQSSAGWQLPRDVHSPNQPHWRGRFGSGKETLVEFSLALHRPLPDAILKQVRWIGERKDRKWFWYLSLTIEEPPVERAPHSSRLTAGLDLGWRVFADGGPNDYVRVGMLADSEGRMLELRLPLRLRNGPRGEWRTIWYFNYLQSQAADFINAGAELAGDRRLGARGLRELVASGHLNAEGISAALATHDLLRKRLTEQRFHALARRQWYYRIWPSGCASVIRE